MLIIEKHNIEDAVKKILPHGSGINYTWIINYKSNGDIVCLNMYDRMDENGFYDGVFPFKVIFKNDGSFNVHFRELTSYGYKLAREEMLKSYLEDVFVESVDKVNDIRTKAKTGFYGEEK